MLSDLAGPVNQLLIPAMETRSVLAWALSGTSAMFKFPLPASASAFAFPVAYGAIIVSYST